MVEVERSLVEPEISPSSTKHTYITRLIMGIEASLRDLGTSASSRQLETWAIFIHESMSISSRNYHSVKHVFDLAEGQSDPILIISAFFHDCIYYHVDGGLSHSQASLLENVFYVEGSVIYLNKSTTSQNDPLLSMVKGVFGFSSGQPIGPMSGLNEFLSAVIAVRELQPVLDIPILAQIACCIEATIPFRRPGKDGTPMEVLHHRMVQVNYDFQLDLTEQTLVKAVQRAAALSNRDLGNFATKDRAWFLDNTWSLLPETNESLRHQYLYTVKEFQHAVYKMNGFFSFLDPTVVFCSFQGLPASDELERMTTQAQRNLDIGRKYVGAKLLSVSVLAAFAELTGGDAPMSLFMGDLPSRHHVSYRLEDALPSPPSSSLEKCDMDVYSILLYGRKAETSFDIRQSPLAAYLYGCMGDDGVQHVLHSCKLYPMEEDNAKELLAAIPRSTLNQIAGNMAAVAVSRADLIRKVVDSLPESDREAQT